MIYSKHRISLWLSNNTVSRRSEDEIYWNAGRNVDVI